MNLIFFEISEKEIITYTVCLSVYKLLPDPEIFKITGKTSKLFSSTYMHFWIILIGEIPERLQHTSTPKMGQIQFVVI